MRKYRLDLARRGLPWLITAVFAIALGMNASPARAQATVRPEQGRHRELALAALAEFEAARYVEALALFEEALRIRPTARLRRGVAKTLFELGRYVECVDQCAVALAQEDDPLPIELRADVETLAARAARFVGRLRVRIERPHTRERVDVDLAIDGVAVEPPSGGGHLVQRLNLGRHSVVVRAPGYRDAARNVEIRGADEVDVTLLLIPEAPRSVMNRVTIMRGTDRFTAGLAVAFGVGGAASLLGGLVWWSERAGAVEACNVAAARGSYCRNASAVASQYDASIVTAIVGGGLLVGAGVLALIAATTSRTHEPGARASAACQPLTGGAYCAGSMTW